MSDFTTGTVKKFDKDKGFGFIAPDDGSAELFLHTKNIGNGDAKAATLTVGTAVQYLVREQKAKGKGKGKKNQQASFEAYDVSLKPAAAATPAPAAAAPAAPAPAKVDPPKPAPEPVAPVAAEPKPAKAAAVPAKSASKNGTNLGDSAAGPAVAAPVVAEPETKSEKEPLAKDDGTVNSREVCCTIM
jgi:cold shock CspA family protein